MRLFLLLMFMLFIAPFSGMADKKLRVEKIFEHTSYQFQRVLHTVQDQHGFIWIATTRRLHRYDGTHIKTYEYTASGNNGLHGSMISNLYLDSKNRIWIQYYTGGVDCFNLIDDSFTFYCKASGLSSNDFVTPQTKSILEASDGSIWIGTRNGLNQIHPDNSITHYFAEQKNSIANNQVTSLMEDSSGLLWIGTTDGLSCYDPMDQTFRNYRHDAISDHNQIASNSIRQLFEDSHGNLWVITEKNGLSKIALNNKGYPIYVDHYHFGDKDQDVVNFIQEVENTIYLGTKNGLFAAKMNGEDFEKILDINAVRATRDDQDRLWVSSIKQIGLIFAVKDKKVVQQLDLPTSSNDQILNDMVMSMQYLENQVLLIGLEWEGLVKVDLKEQPFFTQEDLPTHSTSPSLTHIYSLHDAGKNLWIASKDGLFQYHKKTGRYHHRIQGKSISTISPSKNGFYWLGFFNGKLAQYYPKTNKIIYYNNDPASEYYFEGWSVRSIQEDFSGTLWVSTFDHGVYARKKGESKFLNYTVNGPEGKRLTSNKCYELMVGHDSTIFVGSILGLNRIFPKSGEVKHYLAESNNPAGLRSNYIRNLRQDSQGRTWVGTTEGLHLMDTEKGTFEVFTTADGLASNSIKSIIETADQRFWISTDHGLSHFNPDERQSRNYYQKDGIAGNNFLTNSYSLSSIDETIYLGGISGLTFFQAGDILESKHYATPSITELKIGGKKIQIGDTLKSGFILEKNLHYTDKIVLHHNETDLELSLAAISFDGSGNNKIHYKLEGVDSYWRNASKLQTAYYNQLPEGKHRLQVRVANSDGVWNPQFKSLEIEVLSPWWKSPWLIFWVVVFLVISIYTTSYWRVRNMQRQQRILEHKVQQKTTDLQEKNRELLEQKNEILEQNEEIQSQSMKLHNSHEQINMLLNFGYKVTASVDIRVVFLQISQTLSTLIGADELMLGYINKEKNLIEFWSGGHDEKEPVKDILAIEEKNRLSTYAIRNQEEILTGNLKHKAEELFGEAGEYYHNQPHSGLYLPLHMQERDTVGIIVAKSYTKNDFDEKHMGLLKNLGHYITIALENALAYEKISEQSHELREMNLKNERFYTEVSHEFKTPLSLIISPVKELVKNCQSLTKQEYQILQLVERNAKRLERLVNQILDLRKAETGNTKLNLSRYHLASQVQDITESFKWVGREKEINLEFVDNTLQTEGFFDHDKIEKIVFNLVNNAIKYTPRGGTIWVELEQMKKEQLDYLQIVVRDNGIGIPIHDLDKVFERYYRSERIDSGSQGTGIGLSLVKSFVELHQGSVSVESYEEGPDEHGTKFTVVLPLDTSGLQEQQSISELESILAASQVSYDELLKVDLKSTSHQLPSSKALPSILVIEDNNELREYLRVCLMEEWQVSVARDGIEGVKKAREILPDIILSDVMMPKADGFYVCESLNNDVNTAHIPVILLTAKGDNNSVKQGLKLGAVDYILKPFDMDIVRNKLGNILSKKEKIKGQVKETNILSEFDVNDDEQTFLNQVVAIIEKHIADTQFGVLVLAEEMGMSRTVLYEKLKGLTGRSINDFIRHYRMTLAIKILSEKNYNVAEVATMVGFSDTKYFSKCFKRKFGETPKSFSIQKHKENHKQLGDF
ncbi:hybrid sensor histidine kinase/response regulator transcription factor [Persicobacter diffluens]|uniref:histidine kinase n=1 Tax=Persicobacter diffluens TaxID=981 RepID=A0AAN4W1Z9_9BACT|nr:hypothetical protein PEDI_48710 [Persicobacter diffluens]